MPWISSATRQPSPQRQEDALTRPHKPNADQTTLRFYTTEQVSELTNWSVSHLRRAVRAGKLVAHIHGRSVRFSEADLQAFLSGTRQVKRTAKKASKFKGRE